ncbi:MAG: hypothetical protein AAB325_11360 [Pseudomonadota bacterium]
MALFGGDAPDHPMASIGQAKKLLAELPANDPVEALNDITAWLDSINRAEGFTLYRRFGLVDLLDQTARNHERKVSEEYQSTQRLQKFREDTLWRAAFEFWKRLGDAYGRCAEKLWSDASAASEMRKELPVIVARALRALTLQMKWTLLRYSPVDVRLWGEVGRLYIFAEHKGFATEAIEIYPGAHGQSTVQREFLKTMMLGVSANHGLNPVQQEIAGRAVAHFGKMFALQLQPGPGCSFCFDLAQRKPPTLVPQGFEPNLTTRYFGAGGALATLDALIQEIHQRGGVPGEFNLGANFDGDLVLSTLQHLARHWSDEPPTRRSARRKIAMRLTVVHGFQNLLQAVESPAGGTPLDFERAAATESWIVDNVNEGGMGAVIPKIKDDWIKGGMLLGVQVEGSQAWRAGIIRRIVREESQQRRVGIQMLSQAAIPVKLLPAGKLSQADAAPAGESALLLSATPDKNGEISLLLSAGSGMRDRALEMNVSGKRYHLMPGSLVESGDDYARMTFKMTERVG